MFDKNGHMIGATAGPAAKLGFYGSYAKTEAWGLNDVGSWLGGWAYDITHKNSNICH